MEEQQKLNEETEAPEEFEEVGEEIVVYALVPPPPPPPPLSFSVSEKIPIKSGMA